MLHPTHLAPAATERRLVRAPACYRKHDMSQTAVLIAAISTTLAASYFVGEWLVRDRNAGDGM